MWSGIHQESHSARSENGRKNGNNFSSSTSVSSSVSSRMHHGSLLWWIQTVMEVLVVALVCHGVSVQDGSNILSGFFLVCTYGVHTVLCVIRCVCCYYYYSIVILFYEQLFHYFYYYYYCY